MSLNVGELVATLTVDDSRFTRSMADNSRQMSAFEQTVRQATSRVDSSFRDSVQSADRLGTSARNTARDVGRVGQSANDVGRVGTAARNAAQDVSRIGAAADNAARELSDIGDDSGRDAGGNFLAGFADALSSLPSKAGPVAGSILGVAVLGIGAGVALAAAIKEGMEAELSRDLFQAQTATTTAQAEKFARAAGEAYADVFGASVEENLSTLKLALQSNIIDPGATQRDAEAVVADLDTISTALDTDVATSVTAVSALMSNGLATSAKEAADMIANAVGGSANKGGDLLEVVAEYSSGWKNAGLSAEYALALIEQSTDNGADTADRAGDSLREFGRRITEEGDTIVEAIDNIGLSGTEMYEAFKRGGPDAEEAFDAVFDKIRSIEDPVERNAAAMALLGDTAGDFIGSLAQWDPSEALKNFGEFDGAAGRLASTMAGNPATSVEGAMRSITTVVDGLKGALAEAFGPEVKEWADSISNNRAGVIDFFIGVGNGAFEGAKAVAGFVSSGLEGLAEFTAAGTDMSVSLLRSLADLADGLDTVSTVLSFIVPGMNSLDTGAMADKLNALADSAENTGAGIESSLRSASEFVGGEMVDALDQGQRRFNEVAGNMRLSAAFNDESAKVSAAIAEIGVAADGSMMKVENFTGAATEMLPPGLTSSVRELADGFREQVRTGLEAGNSIETLTAQYAGNYDMLLQQLAATGMSNEAALEYITSLGLTPDLVETLIEQPGMPEAHYALDVLNDKIVAVEGEKAVTVEALTDDAKAELEALGFTVKENTKDGTVTVIAATDEAAEQLRLFRERNRELHMNLTLSATNGPRGITAGQQVSSVDWSAIPRSERADGAFTPKNTNAHIQRNQITVYGEPETEGESYIPHAPSKRARSMSILTETARKFGFGLVREFADGGIVDGMTSWVGHVAPGMQMTSGLRYTDNGHHSTGQAADFSNGTSNTDEMLALANAIADRYPDSLELIYDDPRFNRQIKNGEFVGRDFYANAGDHTNHVHWARAQAPSLMDSDTDFPISTQGSVDPNSKQGIANTIIAEGRKRGMSQKQIKAALMAGLAETDLQNLDYGMDGDNAGILQQRSVGWGSLEDRKDPATAVGMFYDKLAKLDENSMTEAQLAQEVQQSGTEDGSNYAAKAAEADALLASSSAAPTTAPTTASPSTASGVTDTGVAMSTDGQRVYVTNWPATLGGGQAEKPADERVPVLTAGLKVFANGGIEDHTAQIVGAGDMRLFGEPETGGEGYIPLAPSKRPRSVAITKQIANRFGYHLVPMADGGLTGFGGWQNDDRPTLDIPLDGRPVSANKARANAYALTALGIGGLNTLLSGFDGKGNFTGTFDTGSNSPALLEEGLSQVLDVLNQINEGANNPTPVDVQVDIDQGNRSANVSILKRGL
ncbi:phage tail tape measure protein [Rhodococcus kroppenstedtii]|uniref:phage tail tape measure protein n=1 Tax=Rhodococcoides kroppenstedtii TaxID=293050 RepID=UPI002954F1D7|nr:phage tail tape measure protein [Rhodococcus kroppenstedtii]MDV7197034.1 phage tail tape measure protein [Rhodococcus kroppenstedtii]